VNTENSTIFERTRAPKNKFRLVLMNEQEMLSSEDDAAGLTVRDFPSLAAVKIAADRNVRDRITAEVFNDKNECVYHAVRKLHN
jgi:hypothetical protein